MGLAVDIQARIRMLHVIYLHSTYVIPGLTNTFARIILIVCTYFAGWVVGSTKIPIMNSITLLNKQTILQSKQFNPTYNTYPNSFYQRCHRFIQKNSFYKTLVWSFFTYLTLLLGDLLKWRNQQSKSFTSKWLLAMQLSELNRAKSHTRFLQLNMY